MSKMKYTAEQIISRPREAEVLQSIGQNIIGGCRQLGINEQTYYKFKEYGGMRVDQVKRL